MVGMVATGSILRGTVQKCVKEAAKFTLSRESKRNLLPHEKNFFSILVLADSFEGEQPLIPEVLEPFYVFAQKLVNRIAPPARTRPSCCFT